jgi:hypothetical protein
MGKSTGLPRRHDCHRDTEGTEKKDEGDDDPINGVAATLAAGRKEGLEQGSGVFGEHASRYIGAMIELLGCEDFETGAECAAFGIVGAVDYAGNAALNDCAGTHGTGLQSDVERRVCQTVIADNASGFANHNHFGVGGRISIADGAIAAACDYLAIANQNCADGHFACFRGSMGFGQGELHELYVIRHR